MPQEFNVLCCFNCVKYQVHPVKKSNKWTCKVCGSKQSIKKIYCISSSRDCRDVVQKLNTLRGEKLFQEEMLRKHGNVSSNDEQTYNDSSDCNHTQEQFSRGGKSSGYLYDNENFQKKIQCNENSTQKRKGYSPVENLSNFKESIIGDISDEGNKLNKRQKVFHESTCSNFAIDKSILAELPKQNNCDRFNLKDIDLSFGELSHKSRYSPLALKPNSGFQFIVNAAKKSVEN